MFSSHTCILARLASMTGLGTCVAIMWAGSLTCQAEATSTLFAGQADAITHLTNNAIMEALETTIRKASERWSFFGSSCECISRFTRLGQGYEAASLLVLSKIMEERLHGVSTGDTGRIHLPRISIIVAGNCAARMSFLHVYLEAIRPFVDHTARPMFHSILAHSR